MVGNLACKFSSYILAQTAPHSVLLLISFCLDQEMSTSLLPADTAHICKGLD